MQKNISEFISKTFYENKLTNDENHVEKINKDLMYDIIKIENNFSFFDVKYGEEFFEEDKKSYINEKEIKFSFYLIKKIINEILKKIDFYRNERDKKKKENKPENNKNEIEVISEEDEKIKTLRNYKFAIICAYKAQVMKFREMKRKDKFFWDRKLNDIEINTVDSFQGQERDIVIFSTVRANFKDESMDLEDGEIPGSEQSPKQTDTDSNEKSNNNIGIGFLNDFRRMNVGLSRAKAGCFIVGHYETLKNNNYWMKLMNYCKDKKSFFQVEKNKEYDAIKNVFV
jgi:superfamily I DNA and/or RNA helicase